VSSDAVGIVLAIAAPLTWAMYSVGAAHLLHRYSPLRISAIVCLIGTVPLTLLSIGPLAKEQWGSLGLGAWAALLYGALIGYVLATIVWFVAIRRIGAPRASLYQNLQPFLGALFAVVLLSEGLTWIEIIGGAVIGCALLITRKRAPAPTTYDLEAQP
jgi:drug/metabolite transporter (DMT)-like permease